MSNLEWGVHHDERCDVFTAYSLNKMYRMTEWFSEADIGLRKGKSVTLAVFNPRDCGAEEMLYFDDLMQAKAAAEQHAGGWLTIESILPDWKEQKPFMVLRDYGPDAECERYVAVQVSWFQQDMYPCDLQGDIDYGDRVMNATHWKPCDPLPTPPEGK